MCSQNSNFVIKNDKNELIADDIDVAESFKDWSIGKTIAALVENVPFTTDGIEANEKSLFFIQLIAQNFRDPKNIWRLYSPGLDGLTAEIILVSPSVNVLNLTYHMNDALESGTIPKVSKTTRVVPIYNPASNQNMNSTDQHLFSQ